MKKIFKVLWRTIPQKIRFGIVGKVEQKKSSFNRAKKLNSKYEFINRSNENENLLYILSGYKPELWKNVFERIKKFVPPDFDVCIISSGKYVEELSKIAEENAWSYLYTKKNDLSITQNLVISNFLKAKFIWKLDEDMFICKDYFKIMQKTYIDAENNLHYNIGFVGPLIPINSFGYILFLDKIGELDLYQKMFSKAKAGCYYNEGAAALWTFEAQKLMWELTGNIDRCARLFKKNEFGYSVCPVRYSIGAIMFSRDTWEDMGMWRINPKIKSLGTDEDGIASYCMVASKAVVVSHNAVVGHFAFGSSEKKMMEYAKEHLELFEIVD